MQEGVKTGVGRIVWGNPGKAQIKKIQEGPDKGKPVMKDGNPVYQWAFGVAFPKAEFQQLVWPFMLQEAMSGYPNGVPGKFAWKYVDGDGVDSEGKPFNTREGYAGCYILSVSTEAFAPPIYKWNGSTYQQLSGDQIKCGDFVTLTLNLKLNIPQQSTRVPSLYVNPVGILHVGYGQEIQRGGDPTQMFGQQPQQYALPPGASATPLAPNTTTTMPGAMPNTMPGGGMQMQPQHNPGMMQPNMQMQPAPMHNPGNISSGPMPGNPAMMHNPGMPNNGMQPAPGMNNPGTPMMHPQPGQHYQPATDFVHNAGMPQGQPNMQMQPQYQPQQYQQPGQPMMQPNGMPGPNR